MFSKTKKKSEPGSIVSKVTLWYTVFAALLFVVMFGAALTISGAWSDRLSRNELEHETMELSTDMEDFEAFEDGTYFAIYNHNKKLEKGSLPREFDENAPFESGKLSKYSSSQSEFYYFDVYNEKERKWIRGIRSASGLSKELSLFLLSLAIIAPI